MLVEPTNEATSLLRDESIFHEASHVLVTVVSLPISCHSPLYLKSGAGHFPFLRRSWLSGHGLQHPTGIFIQTFAARSPSNGFPTRKICLHVTHEFGSALSSFAHSFISEMALICSVPSSVVIPEQV